MNKNKIITNSILGISALTLMLFPVYRVNALDYVKKDDYKCTETEEHKAWSKLSKSEKKKTMEPTKCYEIVEANSKLVIKKSTTKNNSKNTVRSFSARYDLRDYNYVTPVRNQRMSNGTDSNSCWAFTSNAIIESNYLKNGGTAVELSARHYGFNALRTLTDGTTNLNGYANHTISSTGEDNGGNFFISGTYLMFNKGPITNNKLSIDTINSTRENTLNIKQEYDVDEVRYLESTNDCSDAAINNIKTLITNYGAVGSNMISSTDYLSSDKSSFYYNGSLPAGHAMTIIGWDDNYLASNFKNDPGRNGAWIVKNTYPNLFNIDGEAGYHYVSYADTTACDIVFSVNGVDKNVVDNTYSNSYLGFNGILPINHQSMYFVNKYTKNNSAAEELKEISIFGLAGDTADVYYSTSTNFDNAVKLNSSTVSFDAGGYKTINVNNNIKITADNFYIFVKYTANTSELSGYYDYPVNIVETTDSSDMFYIPSSEVKQNVSYYSNISDPSQLTDTTANSDNMFYYLVSVGTKNESYSINSEEAEPSSTTVDTNGGYFVIPVNLTNLNYSDISVIIRNSNNVDVTNKFNITSVSNGYKISVKEGVTEAGTYTVEFSYGSITSSSTIYIAQGIDSGVGQGSGGEETSPIPVTNITITGPSEVSVNGYLQLSAVITPNDADNKNIDWSSSDETVAVVDNTGRVIGVKAGTATITARAVDGSNVYGSVQVTVVDINAQEGNGTTEPTNPDIIETTTTDNNKPHKEENPKTGISSPIIAAIIVVITSIGVYIINKEQDILKYFK